MRMIISTAMKSDFSVTEQQEQGEQDKCILGVEEDENYDQKMTILGSPGVFAWVAGGHSHDTLFHVEVLLFVKMRI